MHPQDYSYAVHLNQTAVKAGFDLRAHEDTYSLKADNDLFTYADSTEVFAFLHGWNAFKRIKAPHMIDFDPKVDRSVEHITSETEGLEKSLEEARQRVKDQNG